MNVAFASLYSLLCTSYSYSCMPFVSLTRFFRSARFSASQFLVIFLFFASALASHAESIKDIHAAGYVTDLAHVIAPDAKTRLENLCTELEQKTSAQMAIVTVRSLDGETVEQYGNELFK